ncbi:MAG: SH3 domain-containing protein [Gammaproteobacteria bacterium]|nr:SH3 domain-containing protein [Gammaproteobacteria bacterium]
MTKEQLGIAIGVAAGAAAGAMIDDDSGRGAIIGGIVGAIIGGTVGSVLAERDRQRLAQSTGETIMTGEDQEWSNPETGVTARTTVKETVVETREREIPVLKDRVQRVPPLEFIGAEYRTVANSRVRGGPGTDYVIVETLPAGTRTEVLGRVIDEDWFMISRDGVGNGFVATRLLEPAAPDADHKPASAPTTAPAGEVVRASVESAETCRVVTQQVTTASGHSEARDIKACRGPAGWEIVPS